MKSSFTGKNKLTLTLAAIALLGSVGYGSTVAIAKADEGNYHPMIQIFAERFDLNEDEVADTLDEVRADRYAHMQERHEDRLREAVEAGVLTESQMQALSEKHQENWEERSKQREEHRVEMDAWLSEQGIDHEALMEFTNGQRQMGMGHRGKSGSGFGKTNSN